MTQARSSDQPGTSFRRAREASGLGLFVLGLAAASLNAQTALPRNEATRQELETMLAQLPPQQQNGPEGALIRDRLSQGDFRVGDQLVLYIEGEATPSSTLTVTPAQTVVIPGMSEVSLRGVLRSELQELLEAEVRKFIRDPVVRAQALVRLAIMGEVTRPGFYSYPPNTPFSDIFTAAGGLALTSDMSKTAVKRGEDIIWHPQELQPQIASGATLDQLNLQGGDVIEIGRKGSAASTLGIISIALGATVSLLAIVSFTRH